MKSTLFAASLLVAYSSASYAQTQQPNILFILSDNQHAGLLGAYGNQEIKTPNLDQLATEGVKFTNTFAVNGMCSPTRATLMTGLMPSQHGLHDWLNDEEMEGWPDDWSAVAEFRSLPYTLKQHGYNTAMIGKWHLGQPWKPSLGFDHWMTFTSGHTLDFWNNTVIENGQISDISGIHMVDYFGQKAVQYLESYDSDKPFFLKVSFDGPYMDPPTNMGPAKNRHYEYYKDKNLSTFPNEPINKNYLNQLISFAKNNEDEHFLNKIIKMVITDMSGDQATRANMASQNTLVDDNVGMLLDTLNKKGLDKNTIVIYTSDQGVYYGQQGLWTHTILSQPSTLQETAFNVPLIIRSPDASQGKTVNQLIGQYDIPNTILDLAGIKQALPNSPGKSFAQLLENSTSQPIHDAIFYEQTETRGIRTQQYAYWKRMDSEFGPSELYDMINDPNQTNNLADNPEYRDVIAKLDNRLTEFYQQYTDPQYDLWSGGTAKGSISHPKLFQKRFGQDWTVKTDIVPAFKE
ncbi:sulfatase-like hydrolase/transferase [Photobacterium rosenbergii]|uniref:Sulfatase-like hydrolase/transferase n=1 Tax=Photobacterium rosenbergii TaxID=294936 RepID=A0ABU3ZJH3_9GAMM|nr:sulfatase-like hydrolase/transferase [Photobacterium rosenbergii]MDV5170185.1 sulfatase-like hydrolase/transferase [Photobacterium rosenbergii]